MKNSAATYALASLALVFTGLAGEAEAQRFGGFRGGGYRSMPAPSYRSPTRTYTAPRPAPVAPVRTYTPPRAVTSPTRPSSVSTSTTTRHATTGSVTAGKFNNRGNGLTSYRRAQPGSGLSGYRQPNFNGGGGNGRGGRGGNGGGDNNGGNFGNGNGGKRNFGFGGYSTYRPSYEGSNFFRNYLIYSLVFNNTTRNNTWPSSSYSTASKGKDVDMQCAVALLKKRAEYKTYSNAKLEELVRGNTPKVREIIAPCLK